MADFCWFREPSSGPRRPRRAHCSFVSLVIRGRICSHATSWDGFTVSDLPNFPQRQRGITPMTRTDLGIAAAALFAFVSIAPVTDATSVMRAQPLQQGSDVEASGLEVLQLRPNFYMIAGAGGNIGVQVGPDGVVVVDAGVAATADAVLAAIRRRADRPIRYVIDTSADADHVGGNEPLSKAGETLFNLNSPIATAMTNGGAATILAAENVLLRMSAPAGQSSQFPTAAWPTEAFYQPRRYMYLNGEGIEVFHQAAAHTDGDSVVFFRRSDVVMAGDVFDTTRFPVIDVARGGSIQGEIEALNRIVELAIPSIPFDWRDEGTYVIPGHGRLCDQPDVVEYRDMVVIVRDRIQSMVKQGKTLAQIKAASPTQGYTRRYGSDSGPWTTDMFIEAIYKSLARERQP
jgi:glyoxylase-like metal-dependent hydrolase (beta-lactamase superfamily II)